MASSGNRASWSDGDRLLLLLVVLARLALAPWGDVVLFNDTFDYLKIAEQPAWSILAGEPGTAQWARAPGYPLLLKLLGATGERVFGDAGAGRNTTTNAVLVFNVLLTVAALAVVAGLGVRLFEGRRARALWMLFWLLLSLTESVYPWEMLALNEIVALACAWLLLAALVRFQLAPEPSGWLFAAIVALLVFLANLREPLVVIGPAVALVLAAEGLRRRRRGDRATAGEEGGSSPHLVPPPHLTLLVAIVLLAAVASYWRSVGNQATTGIRIGNFLAKHVLEDPAVRDDFAARFQPPAEIMAMAGRPTWTWPAQVRELEWFVDYCQGRHARFLVTSPGLAARIYYRTSLRLVDRVGSYEQYQWPLAGHNRNGSDRLLALSYLLNRLLHLPVLALAAGHGGLCLLLPLAVVVATAFGDVRLGRLHPFAIALLLGLLFYGQYLLTALFDGMEDHRHAVLANQALLLLCWLALVLAAQALLGWRAARAAAAVSPSGEVEPDGDAPAPR